ncbi:MAG: hypothetical protein ICV85_02680 [Tolypothrix sp. T3-bin4]|nr:hypothetical protein [Tolypothrix sp. Co-bin9]MBD0301103.1 hypothetical protein [Tolypothrix sp. T3-bin4]
MGNGQWALGRQCVGRVSRLEASAVNGQWAMAIKQVQLAHAHSNTIFSMPDARCPMPDAPFSIQNS